MRSLENIDEVWFYKDQVRIDQPQKGYRAGLDAAVLAACVDAKNGSKILELGSGSGAVMLLADFRVKNLRFTGLENNPDMVALSRQNASQHMNVEITEGSVVDLPKSWHLQFDQVISNPPFFDNINAIRMSDEKAPSFVSDYGLDEWISAMLKALKPRGYGTIIYRSDGLEKILHTLFGKAGRIKILPIHPFKNEPAKRVLIQFRKGVKSESAILPPLILHDRSSENRFTDDAAKILCGEMPIDMGH